MDSKPDHENPLGAQYQSSPRSSFSSPGPGQYLVDSKDKEKDGGRERLKRHREEVAEKVMIPDKWSQENFLMDWIDYSSFDKILAPNGIASAREALMADGRRRAQRLRIESRC